MRLINTHTLVFEEFIGRCIPRYAILSHTWEEEEVTYEEYVSGNHKQKKGYDKIRMTCKLAAADGIGYAWVDTCCINKQISAELTEAVNSMYPWYAKSVVCYAYLSDLPRKSLLKDCLGKCRWFTRGWTLQELIAPPTLHFFDSAWCAIGTKRSLIDLLSEITRIDSSVLDGTVPLSAFSVAQKMSWAAPRQTTRTEDIAYCLFGIFDLNLPLLYGEGKKAFRRLQEEIIRTKLDFSIFAWQWCRLDENGHPMSDAEYKRTFDPNSSDLVLSGVLAESTAEFYPCVDYISNPEDIYGDVSITNVGIKIHTRVLLYRRKNTEAVSYVLPLSCRSGDQSLGIHLRQAGSQQYLRGDPRLLVKYDTRAALPGKIQSIPPAARHLLVKIPEQSGYQEHRLGYASKILPRVRKQVLQIRLPPHISILEPWPVANFDHHDRLFCFPKYLRNNFGCVRVFAGVPVPRENGSVEAFVFNAWICAVGISLHTVEFSVIESEPTNDAKLSRFLSMATNADYHTGQIRTLLDTCGIPQASSTICPIANTQYIAVLKVEPHFVEDRKICRAGFKRLILDYKIHRMDDRPTIQKNKWVRAEDQMRPDAVRDYNIAACLSIEGPAVGHFTARVSAYDSSYRAVAAPKTSGPK